MQRTVQCTTACGALCNTRGAPRTTLGGSSWRRMDEDNGELLLLNRSDHAAVLPLCYYPYAAHML